MGIIFGKKSKTPQACGVCARRAHNFGVGFINREKYFESLWVCRECLPPEKWHRICSMTNTQLEEVEERSIGVACSEVSISFISPILSCLYELGISDIQNITEEDFAKLCKKVQREGLLINGAKELLEKYSDQLKKWNE